MSAPTWSYDMYTNLANGIVDQVRQTGTAGMPASWPYGPIAKTDVLASGSISPALSTKLQTYLNSGAAASDPDLAGYFGMPTRPAASPNDFITKPLTPEQQLAQMKFEYQMAQDAAQATAAAKTGFGTRSVGSPYSSSGGGGSTAASTAMDEYQAAQIALARDKFVWDQSQASVDAMARAASLAEQARQFNEQLGYSKERDLKAQGLERAQVLAKFASDPGDAVAREAFLRGPAEAVGTPIDIFSGQQSGGPTTLGALMAAQAPLIKQYAQVPQASPTAAPAAAVPAMAWGTRDGWTKAKTFVAGDAQVPGVPNEEVIQLRVKDGEPQAKVTPRNRMPLSRMMAPRYAWGTDIFGNPTWIPDAGATDAWGNPAGTVTTNTAPTMQLSQTTAPASGSYVPATQDSGYYAPGTNPWDATINPATGLPYSNVSTPEQQYATLTTAQALPTGGIVDPMYQTAIAALQAGTPTNVPIGIGDSAETSMIAADIANAGTQSASPGMDNYVSPYAYLTGAQQSTGVTGQSISPLAPLYVPPPSLGYDPSVPLSTIQSPTPSTTGAGFVTIDPATGFPQVMTQPPPTTGAVQTSALPAAPTAPAAMPNTLVAPNVAGGAAPAPAAIATAPATVGTVPAVQSFGGAQVSTPNVQGFQQVLAPGPYVDPSGQGTATLMGGERIGPDGTVYRYNNVTGTWLVVPLAPMPGTQTLPPEAFRPPAVSMGDWAFPQPTYPPAVTLPGQAAAPATLAATQALQVGTTPAAPSAIATAATPPPGAAQVPTNPAAAATVGTPAANTVAGTPAAGQAPPAGGISALTYGADVYNNLPMLQFLRGNTPEQIFANIGNRPIEVPSLGLVGDNALPPVTALNYQKLMYLKQTDPSGYDLLDSMYKAANIPLSSILGYLKERAPLGTAFESTLVGTNPWD